MKQRHEDQLPFYKRLPLSQITQVLPGVQVYLCESARSPAAASVTWIGDLVRQDQWIIPPRQQKTWIVSPYSLASWLACVPCSFIQSQAELGFHHASVYPVRVEYIGMQRHG